MKFHKAFEQASASEFAFQEPAYPMVDVIACSQALRGDFVPVSENASHHKMIPENNFEEKIDGRKILSFKCTFAFSDTFVADYFNIKVKQRLLFVLTKSAMFGTEAG